MVDGNDVYNMAWNDSPLLKRCFPASRSVDDLFPDLRSWVGQGNAYERLYQS